MFPIPRFEISNYYEVKRFYELNVFLNSTNISLFLCILKRLLDPTLE